MYSMVIPSDSLVDAGNQFHKNCVIAIKIIYYVFLPPKLV